MKEGHLSQLLENTSQLTMLVEIGSAICRAGGALLAIAMVALGVDALFALTPWGLILVDLFFVCLIISAGCFTLRQAWRNAFNARRVARQIETHLGVANSRLINSVEFLENPSNSSSRELIDQSIRDGEDMASSLSSFEVVKFRGFLKACGLALGAILFVIVTFASAPRLIAMVLPRYLDPTGDHPPFTLLDFEVTVSPETVYHGRSATISAKLSGPEAVDQASVVFVEGNSRKRLPMYRNSAGEFILPIEQADKTQEFYIDTPSGRSQRLTFSVLKVPYFESVSVHYEFPRYTGWSSVSHALDTRGIRGLEGTKVTLSATGNLPLNSAQMELFGPESEDEKEDRIPYDTVTLHPTEKDVATVSGSFQLQSSGWYRLTLVGVNGARSEEQLEGKIISAPDRMPRISFLEPDPNVIAVEGWKIPVLLQATDDVEIDRIIFLCGVNGWGPDSTLLPLHKDQTTIARADYEFDLKSLGARAGDIITYYASAYDNHPSGEHVSETSRYVIQVISEEEYREYARQQYQMEQLIQEFEDFRTRMDDLKEQREEILKELNELQKKLESGEEMSGEELNRLEQLQKKLEQFAKQAEELSKKMQERSDDPQLYDLEQPYREMLKTLSQQLAQQSESANELKKTSASYGKQPGNTEKRNAFQQAAENFMKKKDPFGKKTEETLDETEQDLEKLRLADSLIAQAERLRAAILYQRDLADRLGEFRDRKSFNPDEMKKMQRMAKEQELLQQEIEEVKTALKEAAKEAAESLPKMSGNAKQICDALEKMQVDQDQDAAARSARKGNGQQAYDSADEAAKKLESLLSDCCSPKSGSESGDLDGCLKLPKQNLKNSLEQLAQGRKIPGIGQKGKSGSGYAGSRAQRAIYGPYQASQGKSDARRAGWMGKRGLGGRGLRGSNNDPVSAETLTPNDHHKTRGASGNMRGVPVEYRDQAEAYFKRLEEGN
ncbi:ATP-binding protein [Gimesia aquarii]|uniref:Chromosome partition protein Smc n=1 Tax=Gimesia aquarii TaxID=2527964 RepID=A0A517VPM8_9PLAN|nr:hypothetical protein [Gimesia aquarii]QDT94975.1 Chromosome partition protein Smc [Gimesia aquarii]